MRWWPAALAVPAVLLLSACAGTTAPVVAESAVHNTGTVQGTFEIEGGPMRPDGTQPPVRPLSGVVTFQDRGTKVSVRVGKTGRFSVRLPAGSYTVSGRASSVRQQLPNGRFTNPPCSSPLTASVHAGKTDRIAVTCIVP